ncbi:MAG: glycosyl transferase [Parachlamydiales bacterium]|nr:glycosyl transferase [Parachlamydiales bacterium]
MSNELIAIIPCYDVSRYCEDVICDIIPLVSHLIAIDDGSTDKTGKILQNLAQEHPRKLTVITFPENRGKGYALIAGFKYALDHFKFKAIVTIDADGQHQAKDIERLARAIFQGAEMAIGTRSFRQMPWKSRTGNLITSFLLSCLYSQAPVDTQSGLRAFSQNLAQEIAQKIPGGHYEMEYKCLLLALKQKRKIEEIPIHTIYIDKNVSSHFRAWNDSVKVIRSLFNHLFGLQ